jgi:1-acyl-sn-glycerol-3-phosphate acyltransferase
VNFSFQLLLLALGWKPLSEAFIKDILASPRCICIYPHTSYFDFFLILLYYAAHSASLPPLYIISRPGEFKIPYLGALMRYCNMIPATSSEEPGQGFVQKTAALFKVAQEKNEQFLIFISPEGKRSASKWRSGYYHLAKTLNIPIRVVGADYELKSVISFSPVYPVGGYETTETELMSQMSLLVPLYPNSSYVSIREHDALLRSPIDVLVFSNIVVGFLCGLCLWTLLGEMPLVFLGLLSTFTSFFYYFSHESSQTLQQLDHFFATLLFLFYIYALAVHKIILRVGWIHFFFFFLTLFFYWMGCGRLPHEARTKTYIIFHTLFHCCTGIAVLYPLFF